MSIDIQREFADAHDFAERLATAALVEIDDEQNEELHDRITATFYSMLLAKNGMKVTQKLPPLPSTEGA